jgi:OmpA-OmpF porin, OOP family
MFATPFKQTITQGKNMKKTIRLTLAATVLSAVAATSFNTFAQDSSGFFVSANIGPSQYKLDDVEKKNKVLAGVGVGYSFTPNVALELGFNDYGKINVDSVNARVSAAHLSLLLSAPVANDFSIYGRLGVARAEMQAEAFGLNFTERKTKGLYGIGAAYNFAKNIQGTIEFQNQNVVDGDVRAVAMGVKFKF